MGESQHTRRPWRAVAAKTPSGIERSTDYAIVDTDRKVIAEAYEVVGTGERRPAEANARLIAAAPDLLAACEAVIAHHKANPFFAAMDRRSLLSLHPYLEPIVAAIAKATNSEASL